MLQAATFREEQEISADSLPLEKELTAEPAGSGASRNAQAAAAGAAPGVDVVSAAAAASAVRQSGTHDLSSMERQAIIDALAKTGGHQGITAMELGISRRTLSRKLKLYNIDPARSHGKLPGDVAELGGEQQLRFRYSLEIPMDVAAGGERFQFQSRNVSCGGVCLQGAQQLPKISGTLSISFQLPECSTPIEATGTNRLDGPRGYGRHSLRQRPAATPRLPSISGSKTNRKQRAGSNPDGREPVQAGSGRSVTRAVSE